MAQRWYQQNKPKLLESDNITLCGHSFGAMKMACILTAIANDENREDAQRIFNKIISININNPFMNYQSVRGWWGALLRLAFIGRDHPPSLSQRLQSIADKGFSLPKCAINLSLSNQDDMLQYTKKGICNMKRKFHKLQVEQYKIRTQDGNHNDGPDEFVDALLYARRPLNAYADHSINPHSEQQDSNHPPNQLDALDDTFDASTSEPRANTGKPNQLEKKLAEQHKDRISKPIQQWEYSTKQNRRYPRENGRLYFLNR